MIDWKLCGMAMLFGSSAWVGFRAAASVRKSLRTLRELRLSLEQMRCEIACRLTPIRTLCGLLADRCQGELGQFYALLGEELLRGEDVPQAALTAKQRSGLCLPQPVERSMDALFADFGAYDYIGQLRRIELAQTEVDAALRRLAAEKANRCRSYLLLGLCTGLGLVILVA